MKPNQTARPPEGTSSVTHTPDVSIKKLMDTAEGSAFFCRLYYFYLCLGGSSCVIAYVTLTPVTSELRRALPDSTDRYVQSRVGVQYAGFAVLIAAHQNHTHTHTHSQGTLSLSGPLCSYT